VPDDLGDGAAVTTRPPVGAGRFALGGHSLRRHAARGVLINTVFLTGLSALGLIKGFVLAAFLSRSDYGIWGVLAVALGTLVWLKQAGIGDKYIQQDEGDQEAAFQKAFTLELIFTTGFVLLMLAALPLVAFVYKAPEAVVPGLVVVTALWGLALQAPVWVYYRRMQFVRQRVLQAVDPVVGFVVSVVLAAMGAGYWALIIGLVAGSWAGAAAALGYSPFPLRLRFERSALRTYTTFSWPLFVASAATIVMAQSGVIGAQLHLGLAGTGVIALAATITAFTDRVDELVTGTLYPAICAVKDRTELLHESFVKSNRLALIWAMPFGVALALFADDLVRFGIGEKWRPAATLLQVTGVAAAFGHIGFNWDAFFRARGDTKPVAVAAVGAMVAFLATGIPLLLLYGLRGFAVGVAVQAAVHLALRGYYLRRLFEGFALTRFALGAMLPTIPAVAVVVLLRLLETGHRTLAIALAELSAYIAVTVLATWYFEGKLLREAIGYVRSSPAAASG
jgi:polysaccharide transporter, PST family